MKLKTTSPLTLAITLSLLVAQIPLSQLAIAQTSGNKARRTGSKVAHKALPKFAINLTALAQQGLIVPAPARMAAVERTIRILSNSTDHNPVLLDETGGANSNAVVENIAQKIATNEVPSSLRDKQIWKLDIAALVANFRVSKDAVSKLDAILAEITSSKGEDILYIDQIASVGAIYGDDVESSLRTALQNNLHCMSAVTNSDYEANNNEEE
ncbi:MAG: hypothetical protein DMF69_08850, partial [Acidobacteria bacterium]